MDIIYHWCLRKCLLTSFGVYVLATTEDVEEEVRSHTLKRPMVLKDFFLLKASSKEKIIKSKFQTEHPLIYTISQDHNLKTREA